MANLNTAQIIDQARGVWGRDVSDSEAQGIMSKTGGGDSVQVTDFLKNDPAFLKQRADAETAAFNATQEAKQKDFLTRFQGAVGAQEKLPDMAARIGGTLGLPQLQQTAQGLIKSVAQIPTVQTQATRGYAVNANQLARIISSKQAELAPAAQQAVTQEQGAEANLATQLGYGVQQQQKDLVPYETEGAMLGDQIAREYSGFTQDKQNALSIYMNQLQNNQALTMQQLKNANDLALAKIQYDNTKTDVSKLLTVSAGSSVYDPSTGQFKQAPSQIKASSGGGASGW